MPTRVEMEGVIFLTADRKSKSRAFEVSGVPFVLDLSDYGKGGSATLHDALPIPLLRKARFSTIAMVSVNEKNPNGVINIGVFTGDTKQMNVIFERGNILPAK